MMNDDDRAILRGAMNVTNRKWEDYEEEIYMCRVVNHHYRRPKTMTIDSSPSNYDEVSSLVVNLQLEYRNFSLDNIPVCYERYNRQNPKMTISVL